VRTTVTSDNWQILLPNRAFSIFAVVKSWPLAKKPPSSLAREWRLVYLHDRWQSDKAGAASYSDTPVVNTRQK
jgi:hypothetical protein